MRAAKSGLPSQKFFLKFYFFIFAFVIEVLHKPVGVVSSFAGLFGVNWSKFGYVLDVVVGIGW